MREISRRLALFAAAAAGLLPAAHAADKMEHRVVFQIDEGDPKVMNQVLNNVTNPLEYYHDKANRRRSRSSPMGRASICCARTNRR